MRDDGGGGKGMKRMEMENIGIELNEWSVESCVGRSARVSACVSACVSAVICCLYFDCLEVGGG